MRAKCHDDRRMGVPEVWVLHLERKLALVLRNDSETELRSGTLALPNTRITFDLGDIFPA